MKGTYTKRQAPVHLTRWYTVKGTNARVSSAELARRIEARLARERKGLRATLRTDQNLREER